MPRKLLGRYAVVRPYYLPEAQLGLPLLLDRQRGRLKPFRDDSWAREEYELAGYVRRQRQQQQKVMRELQLQQQAARVMDHSGFFPIHLLGEFAYGSLNTHPIDSNYAFGVGGDAVAARLLVRESRELNTAYFNIVSYGGTASNVTSLDFELRSSDVGSNVPTSAAAETASYDPGAATGWHAITGLSTTLTTGNAWWLIIGDADGNSSDYARIARTAQNVHDVGSSHHSAVTLFLLGVYTQNGFGSIAASVGFTAPWVLKYADGVFGMPFTGTQATTSNQEQRGLLIGNTSVADFYIWGWLWRQNTTAVNGTNIWKGATGPSGTADHVSTSAINTYLSASSVYGFGTSGFVPYHIEAEETYRIVATYGSNSNAGPEQMVIGEGANADLQAAMPAGGAWGYAYANGTTNWDNDNEYAMPIIALLVDGLPGAASSLPGSAISGSPFLN